MASISCKVKKILIICPASLKVNWKREIEYYQETLVQLQKKIAELDKEVGITTIIIDMIETERVLTLDEKQGKMLLLDSKRKEE
jgi:SNF2 family DNA or RNA helicase